MKAVQHTPESVKGMSEAEVNGHSIRAWQQLYDQIETLLKRFSPVAWSQCVAWKFKEAKGDFKRFSTCPPHFMLRSIEANAAYWRKQNDDPVDQNKFNRVMNAYISFADPLLMSFAATSIINMGIMMHREQIELQVQYSKAEFARLWLLFVANDPMPKTTNAMTQQFGITPAQWLQLSFGTYCAMEQDTNSRTVFEQVNHFAKGVLGADSIEWFVRRISRTPTEFGTYYRKTREDTPKQFHSFIRSAFLETPIMDFGEGRWLAPHPALILRNMTHGLYRLFRELWKANPNQSSDFRAEFADSCEVHVGRVLASYTKPHSVFTERDLKALVDGKVCDYLLESSDTILLVESKSVVFDRDLLLAQAMQGDTSTIRIIEATLQLTDTMTAVRQGSLSTLLQDSTKPVVPIIVTFGDVPYANSDWYFDRVITPRAAADHIELPIGQFTIPSRPIVMSHETFEIFITALNTLDLSPTQIIEKQISEGFLLTGDWGQFLRVLLSGKNIMPLSFVDGPHEEFFQSMGAGDEQ